jgi:hypothetical protein
MSATMREIGGMAKKKEGFHIGERYERSGINYRKTNLHLTFFNHRISLPTKKRANENFSLARFLDLRISEESR